MDKHRMRFITLLIFRAPTLKRRNKRHNINHLCCNLTWPQPCPIKQDQLSCFPETAWREMLAKVMGHKLQEISTAGSPCCTIQDPFSARHSLQRYWKLG
jgi:hypothetical protein